MPNSRQGDQESERQPVTRPPVGLLPKSGAGLLVIGFLLLAGLLMAFYQIQQELDGLEAQLVTDQGELRMKAMAEQVGLLQQRLHGLMADSVEIRLRALERSLAAGQLTPELMQQFDVLKKDILTLEQTAAQVDFQGLDAASAEHPRYQKVPLPAAPTLTRSEMFKEISRLRLLLYFCLTGLVATSGLLVGRYWRLTQKAPGLPGEGVGQRPPLLTRRR